MNKRIFLFLLAAAVSGILLAQEPTAARLQRTPEEEAIKQTERLVRELAIQDSTRIDTIYRMHLKYALLRRSGLTRAQEMERMNAIVAELKQLLTPEEFEQFMNHPAEQPRRPHGAKLIAPRGMREVPVTAPNEPVPDKQVRQEERR